MITNPSARQGRTVAVGCAIFAAALVAAPVAVAQEGGSIHGRVTFESTGDPVHGAIVLVVGTGRTTTTDEQGRFVVQNVRPGTYEVLAQREHLSTTRQVVTVLAEREVEVDFRLQLRPIHEEVTVTATTTGPATTFEAFNSIQSFDTFDAVRSAAPTLADLVQAAPGVEIRSFGPGSSRPIIRGFDGDRVLIMKDGVRSGDLSSQSGDHGTTLDPGALDRVEIVRGPATLLYGSNAVGGVVHAVTPQEAFRRSPFTGWRGQLLSDAGTANGQAGANANVQYGTSGWMFWAGGGSRRSGDYETPIGTVEHSASRLSNGRVGVGYTGTRTFFGLGYDAERGRYGVPFAGEFHGHGDDDEGHAEGDHDEEIVNLLPRRQNIRLDVGARNLQNAFVDTARVVVSYLDWRHDEVEIEDGVDELATRFDNRTVVLRAELEQRRVGRLSGRMGISSEFRDYEAAGDEALANPTTQRSFAAFAYEELDFGPARLMFGGRIDRTSYNTEERHGPDIPATGGHVHGDDEILPPATRDRSFTGGSASVGLHLGVAPGTALVTTLTRSYRAPSLEELYNFGPHVGNLAFEIGNTNLARESTIGLDVSIRHRSPRFRSEFSTFLYSIDSFVFADRDDDESIRGLPVAQFLQGDSRFTGFDGQGSIRAHEHLWVNAGVGFTRARLTTLDEAVPRIPPLHGRVSLDVPWGGFTVSPEVVWAARQSRVFRDETDTAGYALFNLTASYVLPRPHFAHIFSISGRNLTNELYRRHTSFIKDLAPEMGRSLRISYGVRFF
jgi:iron complex outermembrane recepter protein